jgi:hypothetical protein
MPKINIFDYETNGVNTELEYKDGDLVTEISGITQVALLQLDADTGKGIFIEEYTSPKGGYSIDHPEHVKCMGVTGITEIKAHDAAGDVISLKMLFSEIIRHDYFKSFPTMVEKLDAMAELSEKPIFIKKFGFGKFKGRLVEDVYNEDAGYISWVLTKMDNLDDDLRYTLNSLKKNGGNKVSNSSNSYGSGKPTFQFGKLQGLTVQQALETNPEELYKVANAIKKEGPLKASIMEVKDELQEKMKNLQK